MSTSYFPNYQHPCYIAQVAHAFEPGDRLRSPPLNSLVAGTSGNHSVRQEYRCRLRLGVARDACAYYGSMEKRFSIRNMPMNSPADPLVNPQRRATSFVEKMVHPSERMTMRSHIPLGGPERRPRARSCSRGAWRAQLGPCCRTTEYSAEPIKSGRRRSSAVSPPAQAIKRRPPSEREQRRERHHECSLAPEREQIRMRSKRSARHSTVTIVAQGLRRRIV